MQLSVHVIKDDLAICKLYCHVMLPLMPC